LSRQGTLKPAARAVKRLCRGSHRFTGLFPARRTRLREDREATRCGKGALSPFRTDARGAHGRYLVSWKSEAAEPPAADKCLSYIGTEGHHQYAWRP
jgi:hypothetical protein